MTTPMGPIRRWLDTPPATRQYPADPDQRASIRRGIHSDVMARAVEEAERLGRSFKCAGGPASGEIAAAVHSWQAGGCANDGSTCICYCHDGTAP